MEKKVDFEDILDIIGHFGPAQGLILMFSIAVECTGGLVVYYFMFEGGNPGFECHSSNHGNSSLERNDTDTEFANSNNWTSAAVLTSPRNVCPLDAGACQNLSFYDEYTSVVTEWGLVCSDKYVPRLIVSLLFVGLLIGALLGGQLADSYGRKWPLIGSWTLMMSFQALAALSPSWPIYASFRALSGIFCGSIATIASILPMECVGPRWRPYITIRVGWRIGNFLIILLAFVLPQWRHLVVASGMLMVPFVVLAAIFMPESARWLIQKQRYKEASKVLDFVAKLNKTSSPDLTLLTELGEQQKEGDRCTFLDLFRTKTYTARTITVMTGWFVSNTTSYAIQSQIPGDLVGDIYLNVLIACILNIVAVIAASFLIARVGRRKFYPAVMFYPVLAMFTILILDLTGYMKGRESIRTGLALSGFAFISTSWQVDFIYCAEAFPTLVRNLASGAGNVAARFGGIIAPQIGLLGDFHPSIPYVIIGILAVIASVLMYVVMPETKDKPLPEGLPPRRIRASWCIKGLRPDQSEKEDLGGEQESIEL